MKEWKGEEEKVLRKLLMMRKLMRKRGKILQWTYPSQTGRKNLTPPQRGVILLVQELALGLAQVLGLVPVLVLAWQVVLALQVVQGPVLVLICQDLQVLHNSVFFFIASINIPNRFDRIFNGLQTTKRDCVNNLNNFLTQN
jgi:hypothetical protein